MCILLTHNVTLLLQYIINFIIYARRSEQYRKAYVQYLRATFAWLFDINTRRRERTIFILSPVVKKCEAPSASVKLDMKRGIIDQFYFARKDKGASSDSLIKVKVDISKDENLRCETA